MSASVQNKPTVILGASSNPMRYAYLAAERIAQKGHSITAIGAKEGITGGGKPMTTQAPASIDGLHTVTLYLRPALQKQYYGYILQLKPKRLIFNPGTENPELEKLAQQNGIATLQACTLVLLSTGQY